MIAGESGDVSTFLQLVDDDLDIDPYHCTITLYINGLVSTRYSMTQKTMRILSSQKCAKKVCAYLIHLTVERDVSTAGLYSAFLLFSLSAVRGVQLASPDRCAVGGHLLGSADVRR